MLLRLLALAVLVLALAACGERSEPTGEVPPTYPVTVRGAGDGPTVLRERPERIVALDPGSAKLVAALGAGDRLVGVPAGPQAGRSDAKAVVTPNGAIDVPAVVGLHPDLIVATAASDRVELTQAQQRSGAPVYLQPSRTVEDVVRATSELGFLLGEPVRARRLAAKIRRDVGAVEERLRGESVVKVFVDTGLFVTLDSTTIFSDLLRRAKGENVAPEDPSLGPITAAQLRAADPDVYLVTSDSRLTLTALRHKPETKDLRAIEEGRFAVLPLGLVTEAGPDVARALQTLAVDLHPDAFR
jgi:iron complex transport system substrate-binding protein